MTIMIGIDPHKASHTAVAIDNNEVTLDELRVRACAKQTEQLRSWAAPFPDRVWAIESAHGLGYLLAQQLVNRSSIVGIVLLCLARSQQSGACRQHRWDVDNGFRVLRRATSSASAW